MKPKNRDQELTNSTQKKKKIKASHFFFSGKASCNLCYSTKTNTKQSKHPNSLARTSKQRQPQNLTVQSHLISALITSKNPIKESIFMSLKNPINQMASQQIGTRLCLDLTFNNIPSCRLAAAMQKPLCTSDIGHYRSAGKEWMVMGLKSRLWRREDGWLRELANFYKRVLCFRTSLHDVDQRT